MRRTNKSSQLRVRLTDSDREALEGLLIKRGPNSTLSDVVRDAVGSMTGTNATIPVRISQHAFEKLQEYAAELGRSTETVLEDCVYAVEACLDEEKEPLIVREIRLRREYFARGHR